MRTALTIAGSDSGGGAGIQADLKTFAAHGVYGLSAITAVTAQNTRTVSASQALDPALVAAQIAVLADDFTINAVKIGMLASATIAETVAGAIRKHALSPVVLDPVMITKSGARLLDDDAIDVVRLRLLPLVALVTPNAPEAAALTGLPATSREGQIATARRLVEMGARAALVKGGHLDGPATDVLVTKTDTIELPTARITGRHTHGTGCTLSSAIAARLALGESLESAVRAAKSYVTRAIAQAPGLGHGHGPLQHFPA
jgi:hydroxymethylpyrimidine/phosphomethylpyrimidine kinase